MELVSGSEEIARLSVHFLLYCHQSPQALWLQTTGVVYLTVCRSEVQSGFLWAQTKVSAGPRSFLETLEEDLFSCFFHLLEAAHLHGPWALPSLNGHTFLTSHDFDTDSSASPFHL